MMDMDMDMDMNMDIEIIIGSAGLFKKPLANKLAREIKNFSLLYPRDTEGIKEVEISALPSTIKGYKLITGRGGITHPDGNIWINDDYLFADAKKHFLHEVGHLVWKTLSDEEKKLFETGFSQRRYPSLRAEYNLKEFFSEHYKEYHSDKEYKKKYPRKWLFFHNRYFGGKEK